ncbi:MAG: UDP-3-O-(3-hydroxymyristoyl)glucosamine N-acyltransferase [Dehalococcoidia bacterium]|nr:UDP-3-O-(3-hydroxymyristoyl)glucosamine N-acyltransferase [Dehalococcoidia bacterium]
MDKQITVRELCDAVGMDCRVLGGSDRVVARPAAIDPAPPDSVTFYSKGVQGAEQRIGGTAAGVVVCTPEAAATLEAEGDRTLLLVANPRLAFIRIMNRFFAPPRPVGIHPTAVIHPEAKLGKDVYVGPFTYIGKAEIGDGTVIDGHAHIYDNVRIGCRVTIKATAVIGGDGFGFERNDSGEVEDLPDIGGVVVGDDAMIGSAACIDRGALGDTIVGKGSKVDNLVHVAHNVFIGEHCLLVAGAVIGGSVQLGDGSYVGPNAWVTNGLRVGAGAFVTAGAIVTQDVPAGGRVTGNFAIDHQRFIEHMRSIR